MTKLDRLPPKAVLARLRGKIQVVHDRGIIVAKKWPRKRTGALPTAVIENNEQFKRLVEALKNITPHDKTAAIILAHGTGYAWRDVMSRAMTGRLVVANWEEWARALGMDVQAVLDQLTAIGPAIIVKTTDLWVAMPLAEPGKVLTIAEDGQSLEWLAIPEGGISELTGDVIAGPGTGEQTASLSETGVTAGNYDLASITVDAKGRITAATSGEAEVAAIVAHPGYVSGRYYCTQIEGTVTNFSAVSNTIYASPIYVPETTTFTKMAVWNITSSTFNVEMGVYSNNSGVPDQLLHDIGQVVITSGTGMREITGQTIVLTPGWYWLAAAVNATTNMRATPSNSAALAHILGFGSNVTTGAHIQGYTGSWTYSTGNFPTTFPSPSTVSSNNLMVWIGK